MTTNTSTDLGPALTALVQSIADKAADAAVAKYIEAQAQREGREGREEPSPYMSRRAGAEFLGVCEEQLARLAKAGKVKSYRAGRHLRFKKADLAAYIEGSAK